MAAQPLRPGLQPDATEKCYRSFKDDFEGGWVKGSSHEKPSKIGLLAISTPWKFGNLDSEWLS